ncbi:hypothetical protein [Helicobacter sp. T3_23-1059]
MRKYHLTTKMIKIKKVFGFCFLDFRFFYHLLSSLQVDKKWIKICIYSPNTVICHC